MSHPQPSFKIVYIDTHMWYFKTMVFPSLILTNGEPGGNIFMANTQKYLNILKITNMIWYKFLK